jgi:hypothetical protein
MPVSGALSFSRKIPPAKGTTEPSPITSTPAVRPRLNVLPEVSSRRALTRWSGP